MFFPKILHVGTSKHNNGPPSTVVQNLKKGRQSSKWSNIFQNNIKKHFILKSFLFRAFYCIKKNTFYPLSSLLSLFKIIILLHQDVIFLFFLTSFKLLKRGSGDNNNRWKISLLLYIIINFVYDFDWTLLQFNYSLFSKRQIWATNLNIIQFYTPYRYLGYRY